MHTQKEHNQGNERHPGCTHRKSTHTLATETKNNSQTEPPKGSRPLLLLLCYCCCAAAASRPTMHRGAQPVTTDCFSFCVFFLTHAGASNGTAAASAAAAAASAVAMAGAAAQQQQVHQQGRPNIYKHIYLHTRALSGQHSDPCALSALEQFFGDFSAARPRLVARLAPSDSHQPRGPCPRAGAPSPRPYAQG